MANPAVTYTFSNGTTADATQVNQNFSDLIAGLTDGTKDLTISALTASGTVTFSGSVTLGNASGDDLTITASLASSLGIKTTNSYDIGSSTIGLRSLYLADAGSAARSTRLIGATVASSYTFTFPTTGGTSTYLLRTNGSGTTSWQVPAAGSLSNIGLTATVAASALTIALKGADGSDASSTSPVDIVFRSATATTGTPVIRSVTGALSVVVSSGSTLGTVSGVAGFVYVYAIDNAGTVELAVSGTNTFDQGSILTTTAEGGAGGADSGGVIYSASARTGVAIRLLARVKSTQATAGTWATSPSEISLWPFKITPRSEIVLTASNGNGSGNTKIVRFTNIRKQIGDMTLTQSATDGDSVTVNSDGVYSVSLTALNNSGNGLIGITVNDSAMTTNLSSLTYAQGLRMASNAGSVSNALGFAWTGILSSGDIVRIHDQGTATDWDTTDHTLFSVTKVSN